MGWVMIHLHTKDICLFPDTQKTGCEHFVGQVELALTKQGSLLGLPWMQRIGPGNFRVAKQPFGVRHCLCSDHRKIPKVHVFKQNDIIHSTQSNA